MKKLFITLLFAATGLLLFAQNTGDYLSVIGTELEWQDIATWQTWNGNSWEPATDFPATGGTDITYAVTIQSGSDVIFGMVNPFTLTLGDGVTAGSITIMSGGVLTVFISSPDEFSISDNGTLTVDGAFHCTGNVINSGDMAVNGTYSNLLP